ncbi:MAG: O-antigen ligase family protein [Planctomycetaceae bacterium]
MSQETHTRAGTATGGTTKTMGVLRTCGSVLSFLSVTILLLTICSLPWMLGGVIPLARLVLLVGAVTAAVLSVLANLLKGQLPSTLPAVMVPLTLLALLGAFQLRSADDSLAVHMKHAVQPPAFAEPVVSPTHSLSPADTRSTIGTLFALALIACVAFDQFRSPWTIATGCLLLIVNGLAITTVGMSHLFQKKAFFLNENWTLGDPRYRGEAFASFINPNNAAGWLCLCVAVAAGWITWHLKPAATTPSLRRGRLRISFWGRLWQNSTEFMADLTVWQIIAFATVALLAAGVAATRSRGGILALLIAAVLTGCLRSSIRRLPVVILLLAACTAATFGTLQWLDLDAGVVSEMETLKDVDRAVGSRPRHWFDSLHVLLDCPLLGTGLGSYRFATLPYQTVYSELWFRNADNHFLDLTVEGGLIGLLLFVCVGACGVLTGLAAWQQSRKKTLNRNSEAPRVSRRILAGIGTAVVLATLSQAVSGFLDYGVGMPAASSLFVLLMAAAAGFTATTGVRPRPKSAGSVQIGRGAVLLLQLGTIAGAATLIPGQSAETKLDRLIVAGRRILNPPLKTSELNLLAATAKALEQQLQRWPDHAEGRRLEALLADARFRWKFLQAATNQNLTSDAQISTLWDRYTLFGIVDQMWHLERRSPTTTPGLRKQLSILLDEAQLPQKLDLAQQQFPLMPKIAIEQATVAVLMHDAQSFQRQVAACQFVEPANAANQFVLGALALRIGQPELTQKLWQQSLTFSDRFQAAMLTEAKHHWSDVDSLELFGPRDYSACVRAAGTSRDNQQRQELYKRAERYWDDLQQPADADTSLVRVTHLLATQRSNEALELLEASVNLYSEDLRLRTQYARLLEKEGLDRKAIDEWHHILFFEPQNAEADNAVTRILSRKSSPSEQ